MGRIIAIANQKGGVGKTTTAINLAACLAEAGQKILIIDIDPQGNTTSGFGLSKTDIEKTVYEVLLGECNIKDAIVENIIDNLDILPSNVNLAGAEIELVAFEKREFLLHSALEQIKNEFDFILIDCPPSLGLLTLNAFAAAESVIIPIQCEYYALEGLGQLTNTISSLKQIINEQLEIEGILLTMFDKRTNLSALVYDEVKKFFPEKIFKTVIPRNVRLSEAPSFGEPILSYDKFSKGAFAYKALAKEVIKKNVQEA